MTAFMVERKVPGLNTGLLAGAILRFSREEF